MYDFQVLVSGRCNHYLHLCLFSCIKGYLVEINDRLETNYSLLKTKVCCQYDILISELKSMIVHAHAEGQVN